MPTISMFYGILGRLGPGGKWQATVPHQRAGSMRIERIETMPDWKLRITATDGRVGCMDIQPFLQYEAFAALKDTALFHKLNNGRYYIEWDCGADLSADTIEARWKLLTHAESSC